MITEKSLLDYFLKNYLGTTITHSTLYSSYKTIYVGGCDNQKIEDWIVEKVNIVLKLKYLYYYSLNESPPRFSHIPELIKPIRNMKVNIKDGEGELEFIFSDILDTVKISVGNLVNIENYKRDMIGRIRALGKNKINSLLISIGKETELQEEVEEYIKKWLNV